MPFLHCRAADRSALDIPNQSWTANEVQSGGVGVVQSGNLNPKRQRIYPPPGGGDTGGEARYGMYTLSTEGGSRFESGPALHGAYAVCAKTISLLNQLLTAGKDRPPVAMFRRLYGAVGDELVS